MRSKKLSIKSGMPPGSLVLVGAESAEEVQVNRIEFNEKVLKESQGLAPEMFAVEPGVVNWINVSGLHNMGMMEMIRERFNIHPLVIEDILNTLQRPKFEDHGDYALISLKMLQISGEQVSTEQLSLILGKNFVLSFQERSGDVFDPLRERIRNKRGRVRGSGADYLAYCLMDAVVDNYYLVLETVGEDLEGLEDRIIKDPTVDYLRVLYERKRDTSRLRRAVWPLREAIGTMRSSGSALFTPELLKFFLSDVYDHVFQIMDTTETFRDTVTGMVDIYLSSVSNRMNEIMKVLTMIATVFIPLSFIAGIYGMNFNPTVSPWNMPELSWRFGYPFALSLMAAVVLIMLVMFKRKKWL